LLLSLKAKAAIINKQIIKPLKMKNLKFLAIVLALLIGIYSCKKEEKAVVDNTSIVGKWLNIKKEYKTYENGVFKNSDSTAEDVDILEFKTDGTYTYFQENYLENGTYTITNGGKNVTIVVNRKGKTETWSFEIKNLDSKLIIYYVKTSENFKYENTDTYLRQ
jgi:hypothetical protein